ncbi:hypothetical protein WS67_18035 [Burkholderia singularis]|uniref:Uncharacterized protein n=1 Tax=Burkholderia singularis TaxID=1503053 RepID=A0A124P8M2_9BURK|nr:hypothetical protein AQ611_22565 [Burkholderia sp. Bp7605]KVE25789.1 hypothetical protein WS67_18035 [Burkholderia singularis]
MSSGAPARWFASTFRAPVLDCECQSRRAPFIGSQVMRASCRFRAAVVERLSSDDAAALPGR